MRETTEQVRSQGFVVVECQIPPGMTLGEYRARRAAQAPRRKWRLVPFARRRG